MAILFVLLTAAGGTVSAQTVEIDGGTATVAIESQPVDAAPTEDEDPPLEGITIEVPTKIPTTFGFWWRGVKERVAIAVTVDPVKKAEKELQFAEERLKLAEKVAVESADPEMQAKADAMIERANEMMSRLEKRKEKFLQNPGERAERLLKNIATHQERREKVLDRIEERLPEGKRAQFEAHREKMSDQGKRLLEALQNDKVPDGVREHLQNVKVRIEAHGEANEEFRTKRREILQSASSTPEAVKVELEKLHDERKAAMKEIREDFQAKKLELRDERPDSTNTTSLKDAPKMKRDAVSDTLEKPKSVREEVKKQLREERGNSRPKKLDAAR